MLNPSDQRVVSKYVGGFLSCGHVYTAKREEEKIHCKIKFFIFLGKS